MIYQLGDRKPIIRGDYYVAPGAQVIGSIDIGDNVSFWFNSVVRADNDWIKIGDYTNIQECAVIHVDPGEPVYIGYGVTLGHKAMVHSCRIADHCLIGMNVVVLDNAEIGKYSLIGANALVPANTEIPERSLVLGSPGKVVRQLRDTEIEMIKNGAQHYWQKALLHREQLTPFTG